jgi:hypothetical protein
MDGGSFVVSGFLPIAYWTDLTLPDLNADQDANGFDELSVRSDDVIAHLTKRVDILIENNAEHVFDTPARLRLSRGRMFLHALEDVTVVTPAGEVHAKKRALFSVEVRSGTVSVRACSGPGHVSFIVCGQKLCVDPGREMLIADHMPAEQETLPADGVGRRNIRSRVLADGITVTTSDFSLVSMVNSRQHLAQLKCSASAGHILKRLVKTAAALELLSSSKGRYTARPVLDAPEGSDGPYRTVADRTSL